MPFDPVCGRKVKKSNLKYEYQNTVYYFCSEHCMKLFVNNPSKYIIDDWRENSC